MLADSDPLPLHNLRELEFDEPSHTYRYRGEELPGVTRALSEVVRFDHVPEDWLEFRKEVGKAVHAACHYLDEGQLNWSTVDPAADPYVRGYARFLSEKKPIWYLIEKRCVHPVHRYACTPDRYGVMDEEYILLEIKTGALHPAYWLQLAAQREALHCSYQLRGINFAEHRILCLKDDGTYRLHAPPLNLQRQHRNFAAFLGILQTWRWKQEFGV